jgi:hypothetical protein
MSTKIYNGWRQRVEGIADPFALAARFDEVLTPALRAARLRRVMGLAAHIYDVGACEGADVDEVDSTPALLVAEHIVSAGQRQAVRSGRRDPANDFTCDITMGADPGDRSSVYLIVHCEHDLEAALSSIPGVERFAYFDNTDRPSEITAAEWADRRDIWDRVLGGPFSVRTVTWSARDLTCEWIAFDDDGFDAANAALPSPEVRARAILRRHAASNLPAGALVGGSTAALVARIDAARRAVDADTDAIAALAACLDDIDYHLLAGRDAQPE